MRASGTPAPAPARSSVNTSGSPLASSGELAGSVLAVSSASAGIVLAAIRAFEFEFCARFERASMRPAMPASFAVPALLSTAWIASRRICRSSLCSPSMAGVPVGVCSSSPSLSRTVSVCA
eukprot:Amastigsp_a841539_23.p4 type:complete len:121 gc:universal Amastigsp_a841539_23:1648-1286(-)